MSWHTATATDYKDLLTQLEQIATSESIETAVTVTAGGTGYSAGDILTLVGGTKTHTAQVEVTAESAGVVTAVRPTNGGAYTVNPSTPVATTGSGSGCTLTPTFASNGWATDRDDTPGSEKEVVMHATGAVTARVGVRTYTSGSARNWELAGMTGYDASAYASLPGISPGRFEDATNIGAFVTLENASMDFWISVSDRRIVVVAKSTSGYMQAHLGLLAQVATTTEVPYPLYICGNTSDWDMVYNSANLISGLADPIAIGSGAGPGLYRTGAGSWEPIRNSIGVTAGSRVEDNDGVVTPAGIPLDNPTSLPSGDQVVADGGNWDFEKIIKQTGDPAVAEAVIVSTPNIGDDLRPTIPCEVFRADVGSSAYGSQGEIDGVFWIHGAGGFASEDTFVANDIRYRIFASGNRSSRPYAFCVIREQ